MGRRKRSASDFSPAEGVAAILNAEKICWFPVRHYSPACAFHVREVIRALQPDAVLIEGPSDATEHIPAVVHPDTQPPVSILSTWVDRRNVHGLAGILSANEDVPVRFRGWWPLVHYSPEYVALVEGAAIGAELAFIDAPLRATLPFQQAKHGKVSGVVGDRSLAENTYFDALRRKQRRRDFDEFWEANFEVGGVATDTLRFLEAVLTFAWCTRHVTDTGLAEDGTLLREAHMKWHVDQARKKHTGWIVVVTGAFHSVALPWTRGKAAKAKADKQTTTLLCAHSYPALARLYGLNQMPEYGSAVWDAVQAEQPDPFAAAGMKLLVEVMRAAREDGQPVSTADAVGAWRVAQNLASLRGNASPTRPDVLDAVEMAFIKGEAATSGLALKPVARRVFVGSRLGQVTESAGQAPLLGAYYAGCREHRLDVSGEHKVVRCDLGKQIKHRRKSAFLHLADFLNIPMFASADKKRGWGQDEVHFRGPDPIRGENLHLITETWGIRWTEQVDDRLIELADRGSTLQEVAISVIRDDVESARGDVARTTGLLLQTARMMLLDQFDWVLRAVEDALSADNRFLGLAKALLDFQLLYELREGLATHGVVRLLDTIEGTWTAAAMRIPSLAGLESEQIPEAVGALQDVVRLALVFEDRAMDTRLLIERVEALLLEEGCDAALHGAGLGILYSLGHRREAEVATALRDLLRGTDATDAGRFLEGLFTASKSVMLGGGTLLVSIDAVLAELDWAQFREVLPDMRRAFTQFIPSELDRIGAAVAGHIGLGSRTDPDQPVPAALHALLFEMDGRAKGGLAGWMEDPSG